MNIALDYDGTYTEDPVLFNNFLNMCLLRNHNVYLVTMRYDYEIPEFIKEENKLKGIIATGRKSKQKFVNQLGIKIDVWIDDKPYFIYEDALK